MTKRTKSIMHKVGAMETRRILWYLIPLVVVSLFLAGVAFLAAGRFLFSLLDLGIADLLKVIRDESEYLSFDINEIFSFIWDFGEPILLAVFAAATIGIGTLLVTSKPSSLIRRLKEAKKY